MRRVLFLCTGNSARSQIAEGFAKARGADVAEFWSAGSHPEKEVSPFAIRVMAELGVDIARSRPKGISQTPWPFDRLVMVCASAAAHCPVPPENTSVERWDLPDPADAAGSEVEILAVYRATRDDIGERVDDLLIRLRSKIEV